MNRESLLHDKLIISKLIKAIERSEKPDSEDLNYYECWLNALESMLFESNQDLLNRNNST